MPLVNPWQRRDRPRNHAVIDALLGVHSRCSQGLPLVDRGSRQEERQSRDSTRRPSSDGESEFPNSSRPVGRLTVGWKTYSSPDLSIPSPDVWRVGVPSQGRTGREAHRTGRRYERSAGTMRGSPKLCPQSSEPKSSIHCDITFLAGVLEVSLLGLSAGAGWHPALDQSQFGSDASDSGSPGSTVSVASFKY